MVQMQAPVSVNWIRERSNFHLSALQNSLNWPPTAGIRILGSSRSVDASVKQNQQETVGIFQEHVLFSWLRRSKPAELSGHTANARFLQRKNSSRLSERANIAAPQFSLTYGRNLALKAKTEAKRMGHLTKIYAGLGPASDATKTPKKCFSHKHVMRVSIKLNRIQFWILN